MKQFQESHDVKTGQPQKALFKSVPLLRQNPDMLRLFIDNGAIDGTLAASLSFENRYSLGVTVTDYTGDMNMLLVPVTVWLRENQPDIMTTDAGKRHGFTYVADINNNDSIDLRIFAESDRAHAGERMRRCAAHDAVQGTTGVIRPIELYINGELVSQWDE